MNQHAQDSPQSARGAGPGRDLKSPETEPLSVRAHHLLCAVCVRGGCEDPPYGTQALQPLLDAVWEYPNMPLRVMADLELNRAHYFDVFDRRGGRQLPERFEERFSDYVNRRRDLEVCRRLGIAPGMVLPAIWVYRLLFQRAPTVADICGGSQPPSDQWPACPHASAGYYESIAAGTEPGHPTDPEQPAKSTGVWAMMRARTRSEMDRAKVESARVIAEADRLYIRPQHLLCILCTADKQEPLVEDNLVELRLRMKQEPDIPVTVTEGCCMVCDCCEVYDPDEHICYWHHIKNQLRDLNILQKLGLEPGATLPARELYKLVYERIGSLAEVCGWGDGSETAPFWAPCTGWQGQTMERTRRAGIISGRPQPD